MIFEKVIENKEINFDLIIDKIFQDVPPPNNSIILDFIDESPKKLFQNLITIFYKGLVKLYTSTGVDNDFEMNTISDEHLKKLNTYFMSISFNLHYKTVSLISVLKYKKYIIDPDVKYEDLNMDDLELKDLFIYNYVMSNNLEDFKHHIVKKKNNMQYIVWFSEKK